jgi:hypothetical protein
MALLNETSSRYSRQPASYKTLPDRVRHIRSAQPAVSEAAAYVAERLEPYRIWYDRRSRQAKTVFLSMRTCAVIGSCMVPVLINLQFSSGRLISEDPILRGAITFISMIVAIDVALEGVFHFREQWRTFRTTEQMLAHERTIFRTRAGTYHGLSDEDAFALLVDRVESIIVSGGTVALRTLTAEDATKYAGEQNIAG